MYDAIVYYRISAEKVEALIRPEDSEENEVYDLQRSRERQQESARQAAREFLRNRLSADAQYRPIHLDFESLAALLAEFEESENRTALGGCL